jgi:hypothetical protein
MQRRSSGLASLRAALLGASALGGASCVGTPLPEPPDELPAPDYEHFLANDSGVMVVSTGESTVMFGGGRGTVQPNTRVWIVNLDRDVAPVQVDADAEGGFTSPAIRAAADDRIRVLSRTGTQHSAPLDLRVSTPELAAPGSLYVSPLPASDLSCLRITPAATLSLSTAEGTLRVENRCDSEVELTRVGLRFGDQGFELATSPTRLSVGQRTTLDIRDSRAAGAAERLEIVLIDAQTAAGQSGSFAIDVFSALK